jgi:hypothetical protein
MTGSGEDPVIASLKITENLAAYWMPRFPPSMKLRRTKPEPVEALAKTGRGA